MKPPRDPLMPRGMGRDAPPRILTPSEEAVRARHFLAFWLAWRPTKREMDELIRAAQRQAGGYDETQDHPQWKDPSAVELGRRGGMKGGAVRAARMTPEARSESARRAAEARWAQGRLP
jgi:hypothetical protein